MHRATAAPDTSFARPNLAHPGFAPGASDGDDGTERAAPGLRFAGSIRLAERRLVDAVDFNAAAGRWTALLGRSGAGKTTLLKVLAGLALPAEAEIDGAATASDGAPISGRVAWMAQSDLIPPWARAVDAVGMGRRLRGEPIDTAQCGAMLDAVGLSHRANARPAELSGGERQRVALARTLMERRAIALLDEPFSALDAATRAELQELAWRRLAGRTVVFVTHDPMEAARLAHGGYILRANGRLDPLSLDGSPLRDPADPATVAAAARLTAQLRAEP